MQNGPIGIFDSGVGGTSIWKEIQQLLPKEDVIYLADSKNAPYGEKSEEDILKLSIKNTELLLASNCKIIVVACNTATTNAIEYLRNNYKVPFIGIEPAIKPAALYSKSGVIGVLATKGTLSSSLFNNTAENHASKIRTIEQVGTGLVDLVEKGDLKDIDLRNLLEKYMKPMVSAGMDHLVLGCTHYPYLIPLLKGLLPKHIKIIDSGEAVAKQTMVVLKKNNLLKADTSVAIHKLYINSDVSVLAFFVKGVNANITTAYLDF